MIDKQKTYYLYPPKIILTALIILNLMSAGCGQKTPAPLPHPPEVTVVQPVQRMVNDHLELIGNTQAVNTVQLVARVPGYLQKVFFVDGQTVEKGDSLFLIQQDTYQAKLEQADGQVMAQQALLTYAQNQLNRFTELLTQKAAAQSDVDNWHYQRDAAMANLKIAEANRSLAWLDLSYTLVKAPFDGHMDRRLQDPGNHVGSAGETILAQITQTDPIYVYFSVSDYDLIRLLDSMHENTGEPSDEKWPVSMGLVNEEGYPHVGSIDFKASSLTATTGTLLMRGVFPNPEGKILPGSFARIEIPLKKNQAWLIPDSAISNDQQGAYVLKVNEKNIVERQNIKAEFLVDDLRVIINGLNGTEQVIIKGLQRAIPGKSVSPNKESPEAP
ncbi:MAG: efflux RND transporter periplasmic adaptor subunit [Candidatus Omnitrophica bacterium]|nr:efflux RND transporter periplasmic adaptor subunit [Candidatus Omnitrophota bacterium]